MKTKEKRRGKAGRILLALFLIMLFTGAILASSFVLYMKKGIDASLDLDLLISEQGRTTKLYYTNADGTETELEAERLHGRENRIWIPLSEIPRDVQNAFIAIEDHRFYEHPGVDIRRTGGAVLGFASGEGASFGGSTITQQLIKNLTGDNKATVRRKLSEIMRALELEKKVSKETILELYLNTVYLAEGCYGLETAAEKYFGKSASQLTLTEGAALAAIIQYPSRYDPLAHPEWNKERRNTILWRMHELGLIGDAAYEEAIHAETELHPNEKEKEAGRLSWFTEAVIEDVIGDLMEKYLLSRTAASRMLYNGGLSIHTTMDARLQKTLEEYYADMDNIPTSAEGGRADSAAVIIDPKTGHLLAVVGGTGEKNSDRVFSLATQMLRSPGSVIKPISVYAPALEKDLITWASVYDDVPVSFTEKNGVYTAWPKNNPRVYSGLCTVNTAVTKSINTVAVQIVKKLGLTASYRFLESVGIRTLVEYEKSGGRELSDLAPAPLALGAVTRGVSVREMTGAYTMLAGGTGVHYDTISYTAVYDKDGKLLLSHEGEGKEVIGADTVEIMTKLLQNVVQYGTASDMTLSRSVPVAGKTGTSNANTDRWFIGYTPDLLCGIWYGHKDASDIGTHKTNPAVTIFDGLMSRIYARGASDLISLSKKHTFPKSGNVISALYCKDSGMTPAYACSHDVRGHRVVLGYFKKGTVPQNACDKHILLDYDKKEKTLASENTAPEDIIRVAFVKNYARSFPCQVRVTDAEFMYRHLPFGALPTTDPEKAFFQDYYENGHYIGISGAGMAHNRYLSEKPPEETTEETTEDTAIEETTAPEMSIPLSPSVETAPSVSETEQTTESEKKKLVPWW